MPPAEFDPNSFSVRLATLIADVQTLNKNLHDAMQTVFTELQDIKSDARKVDSRVSGHDGMLLRLADTIDGFTKARAALTNTVGELAEAYRRGRYLAWAFALTFGVGVWAYDHGYLLFNPAGKNEVVMTLPAKESPSRTGQPPR